MREDFRNGLVNFKKAEKLYKKIGDRVSYAYTLWSVGTTYKMLGKYKEAVKCFNSAAELFKVTKDPRGKIYCILGSAEVDYLEGEIKKAKKGFARGLKRAEQYGFKVEKGYAKKLIRAGEKGKGLPINLP
jgi:tetratricopeptide (TPR) repeat protein